MAKKFRLQNVQEKLKKDTYYRLDFVTSLDLTKSYQTDSCFTTLLVNFAEYSQEYQDIKKIKSLTSIERFKNNINDKKIILDTVVLPEDITNIFFLKPGTIWRNGALIWEPDTLVNIEVNQASKTLTDFKTEKGSQAFPYIKNNLYSNLLKFPNSFVDGRKATIFISAMEVIRYYYSGSRYFTSELFNGGMEANQIKSAFLYKQSFDQQNKNVYIWLKRKCYDSDAIMLARAVACKEAHNSMRLIYSSLINRIDSYERKTSRILPSCCPRADLPFLGSTEMEVHGQWLPPNSNNEFAYLLRSIESCNHKLPFDSLELESVDSYASSGRSSSKQLQPQIQTKVYKDAKSNVPIFTEGQKPTEKIEPQELDFYKDRFPYLSEIKISKISKTSDKDMETYKQRERKESSTDKASSQKGNYSLNNVLEPWEIITKNDESIAISKRLDLTAQTIENIANVLHLTIKPLPVNAVDNSLPYGYYEFRRPSNKSIAYTWTSLGKRNRKALFAVVKSSQSVIYLLDIEGKNNLAYSLYIFSDATYSSIENIAERFLQDIADKSAKNIIKDVFYKYFNRVNSLKHTTNNDDSFADRLQKTIEETLAN